MDEGLLSEDRAKLLLSWRHSGFSVHNAVTVAPDDPHGLERLARYLVRPPVSLGRLELVDEDERATYRVKRSAKSESAGQEVVESFDPRDLLARILMHVVEPRAQVIRYYGEYAVRARATRRRDGRPLEHGRDPATDSEIANPDGPPDETSGADQATRRAQRRAWAQCIRRIYEIDPLHCECGATMKIISFITEAGIVDDILRHLNEHGRPPGRGPPEDHNPAPL